MRLYFRKALVLLAILLMAAAVSAQNYLREINIPKGANVEIINHFGRVDATVEERSGDASIADPPQPVKYPLTAKGNKTILETDLKITADGGKVRIEADPKDNSKRIDISLKLPERVRLQVETYSGEVRATGNLEFIDIKTETGTIAIDVPTVDLRYYLQWMASRPRFLSDFELAKVKEKSGGRFEIRGAFKDDNEPEKKPGGVVEGETKPEPLPRHVAVNLVTDRGIILLNVPPNEVSSDLRERPLTNAAKAIIRSGDSLLMEAIRRASPKYFGDYAKTLPPARREPTLTDAKPGVQAPAAELKKVQVRVTDINNRAIGDLKAGDFEIAENGQPREIVSAEPETAPFNLVLLLDVSGSIENYVTFIRKAARNFVDTVSPQDRISIVIFNDDIKALSPFTTDKAQLSKSLDTFDAGGGTAYYDSLAFALTDTLRPLKGDRTAIVILSDGDDNQSFLPFDALLGSIQESGALIYPLYVPSSLIAAASSANPNFSVDPLRSRYMGLNTKAEGEGEKLAQVSGGVYYPITQLSQLQKAYDDIVVQLRTAYTITFRSGSAEAGTTGTSPRLKVRTRREGYFVKAGAVTVVE